MPQPPTPDAVETRDPAELIGSGDACKILGIDRSTLTRWVRSGRITPAGKLGNRSRTGAFVFWRTDIETVACGQLTAAQAPAKGAEQ